MTYAQPLGFLEHRNHNLVSRSVLQWSWNVIIDDKYTNIIIRLLHDPKSLRHRTLFQRCVAVSKQNLRQRITSLNVTLEDTELINYSPRW